MVVIRADGNSTIGMGHIMRCKTIATSIQKMGEAVCFVVSADSEMVEDFDCIALTDADAEEKWSIDDLIEVVKNLNADKVLIDSYRINKEMLRKINSIVSCYYIDDSLCADYPVANIINYNLYADKEKYKKENNFVQNVYCGSWFFPVRNEIVENRVNILNQRIKKVLITTGATDSYNIVLNILDRVSDNTDIEFIVLCGIFYKAEYLEAIYAYSKKHSNVTVMEWTNQIGRLYADCDLVITPGSTSMLEAITVGVPCISYSFVDNQILQCEVMDEMDMAPYAGDIRNDKNKVCNSINYLLGSARDIEKRNGWRMRYAKLFDGKGAQRIARLLSPPPPTRRRKDGK